MPPRSTRHSIGTTYAACLLLLTTAVVPVSARAATIDDGAITASNTTEPLRANKAQLKSQSAQSLRDNVTADPAASATKRARVTIPSREDTAPTVMESKGLRGKASFYSPRFQGRKTASGDIFNNKLFTAASNLIPLGTLVAVKRPDTNLCVVVKVNDRMHAKHEARIIDLSQSAAKYLDMVRDGIVKVQITRVPPDATEGSVINCAMGYELEEICEDCNTENSPLQFKDN